MALIHKIREGPLVPSTDHLTTLTRTNKFSSNSWARASRAGAATAGPSTAGAGALTAATVGWGLSYGPPWAHYLGG
jgi:hypothetical protein